MNNIYYHINEKLFIMGIISIKNIIYIVILEIIQY